MSNPVAAAVLYARVSSREQEQEGYSIPAQLKLLRDYASRNGFRIEREFLDIETAKTTGRKSFSEMVEFLKRSRNCRTVLVEKTDRLYRNFRDAVTLEDLETEIHFIKENQILSKNSRSQDKLAHGLHLLIARNYVENLREEVIKGMREKAEQGIYPGRAPFGYRNNREKRSIEIHPENSPVVKFIFEHYATGQYSLITLRNAVREELGKTIARSYRKRSSPIRPISECSNGRERVIAVRTKRSSLQCFSNRCRRSSTVTTKASTGNTRSRSEEC